ncbi:MAG: M50 family metallopeptidase [Desulfuromonadales bacterium]
MLSQPAIVGFLVASLVLGAVHRRLSSSGSFLAILYCLPFTIMHELSHFVAALLTGGRPSSFSVWPRRSGNGWVLGNVRFVPTLLSAVPTALAPLVWLVVGYYSMVLWDVRPVWVPEYLLVAILYACTAACTPSWQDIKVALANPFSLLIYVAAAYIIAKVMRAGLHLWV